MTENVVPTNASQKSDATSWRIRKSTSWLRGGYKIELIDNKNNKPLYSERCSWVGNEIENLKLSKNQFVSVQLEEGNNTLTNRRISIVTQNQEKDVRESDDVEMRTIPTDSNIQKCESSLIRATNLTTVESFYNQTQGLPPLPKDMAVIPPIKDMKNILSLQPGQLYCYEDPKGLVIYRKKTTKPNNLERYTLNKNETDALLHGYVSKISGEYHLPPSQLIFIYHKTSARDRQIPIFRKICVGEVMDKNAIVFLTKQELESLNQSLNPVPIKGVCDGVIINKHKFHFISENDIQSIIQSIMSKKSRTR